MTETDFLRHLRTTPTPGVPVGPGDDCAVLPDGTLITTDILTEGVDFHLAEAGAYAVGRKAMGVNLSDIAAMGGTPTFALVGLVLPPECDVLELQRGLSEMAAEYGVPIVGGDTNSWDGGLVVSVTVLGKALGTPILRSGAKPGDAICVTGPLGGSLLGRHLHPVPRLAEVERLLKIGAIHSMIDISDGLAKDLHHICEMSGVGAEIDADMIPIHADAEQRALQTGHTALHHALHDGEDFELVFTCTPELATFLDTTIIGTITAAGGYRIRYPHGLEPLQPKGWEHTWTE
jgi:thiamine-monophosphate kinase